MSDLVTLRPEVQEALHRINRNFHISADYDTIRAELLRLAECEQAAGQLAIEKAEFRQRNERAEAELAEARKNETVALGLWNAAEGRATKAESELAEAQNTIAAQQGTMGALKRKLALAERELAALKARMKPCARVRDGEVNVYMDVAHEGKKVAVLVVEE